MKKLILLTAIGIVLIANFTPISYLLDEGYAYTNYNGKFKFKEEGSGHDFKMAKTLYKWYLESHPDDAKIDPKLYRTFKIKLWHFWEWRAMIFDKERYQLPYRPPQVKK
ncbi:hypothetical protein FPZ42_06975 [Mucilaginibacter achroorhodeus]|uniref:Uncharacterized protein n=1 Tax=Mucilaginibacter achroorhodeus TaxID=2599294 RepID=A0A563U622_9SPHI|nr:hypothetical protein [Mucilaginibacter achroorhodeus]TWR26773.1 hypothetical protein FPZ42_06975 [Mucilaginibacter achroorhodeus]